MFNLILKDLRSLRNKWVFFLLWLFLASSGNVMAVPVAYFSLSLFFASLGLTEKFKTESLFCSLPIKRSSIVCSKYVEVLLFFATALVMTYLLALIRTHIGEKVVLTFSMHNMFALFFPYVIILSAFLPVYFRFGLELGKSAGSIVASLGLILVVAAIIFLYIFPTLGSVYDLKYSYVYLSIGMAISVVISIKYSLKFYSLRDFN